MARERPDDAAELTFPVGGIDRQAEWELQPKGTTPAGVNVRAFDPDLSRARGGSRPGLAKYINAMVGGNDSLIQMLDYIVDPTTPALLTSDDLTGATIDDPSDNPTGDLRNPGRRIRAGGSGVQPNRNVATQDAPPLVISLVQSAQAEYESSDERREPQFDAQPANNNLLVVVVTQFGDDNGDVQVQNDLLNGYTQAGTYAEVEPQFTVGFLRQSIWYRVATAGASETKVKITPATPVQMVVFLLEYQNTATGSPLDAQSQGAGVFSDPEMSPGLLDLNAAAEVALAAYAGIGSVDTDVPGAGFSLVEDHGDPVSTGVTDIQAFVAHKLPQSADVTPTATFAGGGQDWVATGASFKPGQ